MCFHCQLKFDVHIAGLVKPHLTAQSGELAEGDDQVVEHVTEAVVSRYHGALPERDRNTHADAVKLHRTHKTQNNNTLLYISVMNVWSNGEYGRDEYYSTSASKIHEGKGQNCPKEI